MGLEAEWRRMAGEVWLECVQGDDCNGVGSREWSANFCGAGTMGDFSLYPWCLVWHLAPIRGSGNSYWMTE